MFEHPHLSARPDPFYSYVGIAALVSSTFPAVVPLKANSIPFQLAVPPLSTRLYPALLVIVALHLFLANHYPVATV